MININRYIILYIMRQYICTICNKCFSTKQNYNRHINNENIHMKVQKNIDEYKYKCDCGKKYLHLSNLSTHKRTCSIILDVPQSDNIIDNELLQTQFQKEKEELLKQFEIEKQELLKQVETEKLRNTNNIDTQNCLNIQINAFGCENLEHITEAFKVKCLKQIYKSIPEMVIKIHFNTQYPENKNVKIPNKKLPYASIMTKDNTWKTVDKKNMITSMVDKSFNMLDDTYEEHKGELSETKRKNYEKYQEKYWKNDKQLHKQLETDVECLVLDGTR
jgi:hypothetical protein